MTIRPVRAFVSSLVAAMLGAGTGCSAGVASPEGAPDEEPGHDAGVDARSSGAVLDREGSTDGSDASPVHGEAGARSYPVGAVVWPPNGHGYLLVTQTKPLTWEAARTAAQSKGGHLVTITSEDENDFVYSLVGTMNAAYDNGGAGDNGPWLGAYQPDGSAEPAGGWTWVTGEPFDYAEWAHCLDGTCTQPDNYGPGGIAENYLDYYANWQSSGVPPAAGVNRGPLFNDTYLDSPVIAYIVEFE